MNTQELRDYHDRLRREYRAMLGCVDDPSLPLPLRGDEDEDWDKELEEERLTED